MSCIPMTPGSSYTYCAAPGAEGAACDTKPDCESGNYCAGDNCADLNGIGDACGADDQCSAGYCDTGGSGNCENFLAVGDACTLSKQCNPASSVGCYTSDDDNDGLIDEQVCRSALLPNSSKCIEAENSCASGVCDFDIFDGFYSCITGAQLNEACDNEPITLDTKCAPGLYCHPEDATCEEKLGAGGVCEDNGADQCLSGVCDPDAPWDQDMCTDAPESPDTVTCDGVD
jgi:hypothetical protein